MPNPVRADTDARSDIRGGLPVGTRLGRYALKSILGQGAFGITYRAHDVDRDRDVAIKEYLPATLALREGRTTVTPRSGELAEQFVWGRDRFLEEANTLKLLDGTPSIVQVLDFLEANGTAYMVMALIEGETLARQLLRDRRLTAESAEPLLFSLLDGLERVHAIGFLHRDIKPANIMIGLQGEPTLIDFGASRAALAGRSTTFTAIFTPGYAAVEQFASTNLGPWTDLYGLAATLYHAITGRIPPSAIERMLKDEYEPMIDLQPMGYRFGFLEGIDAALAVSCEARPQSVADWRRMLSASRETTRVARRRGRLARVASKAKRARLSVGAPAIGLASVVALGLVGGAAYFASTANAPAPPTVSAAASTLSAEELEQALAERRRADALAADKRRLEEESRQKAEADAEAKRLAEVELEQTRQARQKAEQELGELKERIAAAGARQTGLDQVVLAAQREADEDSQRKAEAGAAALRQAEEDARKKVETETEAKRQADQALAKAEAERQQAEQEARQKAAAEQAALRQASEEAQRQAAEAESVRQAEASRAIAEGERERAAAQRQQAEAEARMEAEVGEKALRLDQSSRERVQVALTALGFDTRGTDGILGPRSREMISAWQKARRQPSTGFLSMAQRESLMKEAAPALSKYDEQKKSEEERKAAEATMTAATLPSATNNTSATAVAPGLPAQAGPVAPAVASAAPTMPIRTRASLIAARGNLAGCPGTDYKTISVTIYPNRIEMRLPWGWEAFKLDADGTFSGTVLGPASARFTNTYTMTRLSADGNVNSKPIRLQILGTAGSVFCTYTGTIA